MSRYPRGHFCIDPYPGSETDMNTVFRYLCITLLASASLAAMASSAAERPNILLIFSDDHGVQDSGVYGNAIIKTPNIDGLAAEGMHFDSAFATQAICAPSRQSLYTGLYPIHHGGHRNHTQVLPGTLSLPHYFEPLGYRVHLAGKTHFGPSEAFPFNKLSTSKNTFSDSSSDIAQYFADMQRVFNRPDQPFFIVAATSLPHTQFGINEGYPAPENYDPKTIPLPPYLIDTPETRIERAGYYELVTQLDADIGTLLQLLKQSAAADNTLVIYSSDHGAGFAFEKWTNYDAGLHVPLIVKWPNRIKANSESDALVSLIDLLPTLMEAAGGQAPENIDGKSFLPLLSGDADKHRELVFASHTTLGIRNASDATPIRSVRSKRYKYIRNLNPVGHNANAATEKGQGGWFSWLEKSKSDAFTAQQIQRYHNRPSEEFYDLLNDPYELKNLAASPDIQAEKAKLSAQLDAWMAQQNDLGLDAPVTPMNMPWWQLLLAGVFIAVQFITGLFISH